MNLASSETLPFSDYYANDYFNQYHTFSLSNNSLSSSLSWSLLNYSSTYSRYCSYLALHSWSSDSGTLISYSLKDLKREIPVMIFLRF